MIPSSNTNIEFTIKPNKRINLGLEELWRFRELFYFFTWRDIKVKYKQTILGFVWAVLQPLLMMGIFVVFFANLLQISTDGIPAPIFYFSGLLLWNLFSSGLSGSANSLVANANIIKKIYFPRLIIPLSAILVSFFDFLMAIMVFILIVVYYSIIGDCYVSYLLLPYFFISLVITLLFCVGLGVLLGSLNVKYRDFRYVIPFFIQFLMFLSPVIYPISILSNAHGWIKYIFAINPLTGALNLIRASFNSEVQVDWGIISISFTSAMIIFILGIYTFRKNEAYFADLV